MNTARRLAKNTLASLLTQVSTPMASFMLVLIIARRLGTSGLGEYSVALSLYFIFQALSTFGFNLLITREVARDSSITNKYFVNGTLLAFSFSIVSAFMMCIAVNWITAAPTIKHSVYVLSSSLLFFSLALVYQSICRAFEKLEYITIPHIVGNMCKLVFGIFSLYLGYGLVALMVVILLSQIVNFILSLYFCLRFIKKPVGKLDFKFCIAILSSIPIFTLIIILSTIRGNIDILLLTKMLGTEEAGYYSAAHKLVNLSKLGISCYIMALQPIIFRLFVSSLQKSKTVCTESIRYLVITVLPIIVSVVMLSDRIILLVFKEAFLPSAHVLSITIWILLFYSFNQVLATALIGSDNQRKNLEANLIGLATSIGLNIILIPRYSFIGAAIATCTSVSIVAAVQYHFVAKNLFKINFLKFAQKPFAASALMAVVLLLFRNGNLVIITIMSTSIYVLCLFALKTFSQKDVEFLRSLWEGKATFNGISS
jgi:O-antigen/teichoic acid export membrane protein